jgi:hypothetical protein
MKPSKAQLAAQVRILDYLSEHDRQIDEHETSPEGIITITTTTRDESDTGDEEPNEAAVRTERLFARELLGLSRHVFVDMEAIDEWIDLTIKIRPTTRQPKPKHNNNLPEKVQEGLWSSITHHDRVKLIASNPNTQKVGAIEIHTDIEGRYGSFSIPLTWDIKGDTIEGWDLIVEWGRHSITTPLKDKTLDATLINDLLADILHKLTDPLDAFSWTFNGKKDGSFLTKWDAGKVKESYSQRVILSDAGKVRHNRADTIIATNPLTNEVLELKIGDTFPERLLNIKLTK